MVYFPTRDDWPYFTVPMPFWPVGWLTKHHVSTNAVFIDFRPTAKSYIYANSNLNDYVIKMSQSYQSCILKVVGS